MEKFTILSYNEVKVKKVSDYESQFVVKPLERGFANTLGNSIRRVLLSSVPSVAPFAIRIAGVNHEFQTIENVKEDVVKLILNFKNIKFKHTPDSVGEEEYLTISLKSKKGEVTANDLVLPLGLEVVNPKLVLANTLVDSALNIELFIRGGRGFKSFEDNKFLLKYIQNKLDSKLKTGSIIAMDSNFSPILNVSYDVDELNSSSTIIEEKLTLNVKTDGSIFAKDAISQAAYILSSHLEVLANVSNLEQKEIFSETANPLKIKKDSSSMSIVDLNLSVRSYNSLKRAGIENIGQLSEMSKQEIESIQNLGVKSLNEILEKLNELGIKIIGAEVSK